MISKWLLAAAPLLVALPAIVSAVSAEKASPAPSVATGDLMRHITILASDAFEGRKPGTPGETKTLHYIATQLAALGLEPGGPDGWYQPVGLIERQPISHDAGWSGSEGATRISGGDFRLVGRGETEAIANAPAYYVGHGLVMPEAGIDQLAGADLQGAIVFLWFTAPQGLENVPRFSDRVTALKNRGAAAVIAFVPEAANWKNVAGSLRSTSLQLDDLPAITGFADYSVVARLSEAGAKPRPDYDVRAFKPVKLDGTGSLRARTQIRKYDSYNVVGRLRGSGDTGEHVLYLGHWDHFGICRPEGTADRICNGAVDNASGIASIIEIARHMTKGPRPQRDLLFMGTTAEEMGLLGAYYFAARPVVPAKSIVAAINIDTIAIAPRGAPIAILGRGTTKLDPIVDATAQALGRKVDTDDEANAFVQRQDGWPLTRAGIPTVMANGSFSDMAVLRAFLGGPYHKPEEDLNRPIELGGAVEDTELMIALGRNLADPRIYPTPAR